MKTPNSAETKQLQKLKLKKNAMDQVDFEMEWRKDPKFKTEPCKGYEARGVCIYGNKCRFAHGKHELFDKSINLQNYKQKDCNSFFHSGFCAYGYRCHFRHYTKDIKQLNRSYYSFLCDILPLSQQENNKVNNVNIKTIINNFESPSGYKNKATLLNQSTASSNSMESNNSEVNDNKDDNCGRRLKIFKDISMKGVRKNLSNTFDKCELQTFNSHFYVVC